MAGHISTLCFKFCDVVLASYHNQRLGNFTEWSLSKGRLKIKGVVLRSTDQLPSLLSGILLKCGRDQSGARSFRAPQGWPVPRLPLVSVGPHQSSCRRKRAARPLLNVVSEEVLPIKRAEKRPWSNSELPERWIFKHQLLTSVVLSDDQNFDLSNHKSSKPGRKHRKKCGLWGNAEHQIPMN